VTDYAAEWDSLPGKGKAPLPAGVPEKDRAAYTYVNERTKRGMPATAAPTASGGLDVLSGGSARPEDLRAQEGRDYAAEWDAIPASKSGSAIDQIPDMQPEGKPAAETPWYKRPLTGAVGSIEAAGTLASGAMAAPVAAVGGIASNIMSGKFGTEQGSRIARERAAEIQSSLTYRPRTEAGQGAVEAIGDIADATKIQGLGPAEAVPLAAIMTGPRALPKVMERPTLRSVGAAATEPVAVVRGAVANSSPELQSVVESVIKKNGRVDMPTLTRHVEADSLPVPVHLTKGQATGDVSLLSMEQNSRGKNKSLAERFQDQNKALVENTNAIRERAAPDVYAQTKPEHGELLIDAYKAKDRALNEGISARYKALKEANGGDFPLDAKRFVDAADEALHKDLLFDHVDPGVRKTLDRLKSGSNGISGGMTFENFESLRTRLAAIQRSQSADGNVKAAAGVIRDALEELPMPPGAEHLKPLADAARNAAKERFALIKGDPAYKAVVEGKASADGFVDKYVIASDLKNLQALKANLAENPTALQAVASGTVNHLKASAGINSEGMGNFSQAGYNRALERISPKLGVIFDPESRKNVETLGKVARYTQEQPRGSYVNNSNTLVGALAEAAKSGAEGAANVAAGGVPIGSWARKMAKIAQERKDLKETLQTGAGIKLRDVGR
jgi:hypothetical protein